MIVEIATVMVKSGQTEAYEAAFGQAEKLLPSVEGYISHELLRCQETPGRYQLLIRWTSLEAHMVGFRESPQFQQWRNLLHHFYEPTRLVEHYDIVAASTT